MFVARRRQESELCGGFRLSVSSRVKMISDKLDLIIIYYTHDEFEKLSNARIYLCLLL